MVRVLKSINFFFIFSFHWCFLFFCQMSFTQHFSSNRTIFFSNIPLLLIALSQSFYLYHFHCFRCSVYSELFLKLQAYYFFHCFRCLFILSFSDCFCPLLVKDKKWRILFEYCSIAFPLWILFRLWPFYQKIFISNELISIRIKIYFIVKQTSEAF